MQPPPAVRGPSTSTDPSARLWSAQDLVTGLRVWGTTIEHDFPAAFLDRLVPRIVIGKEAVAGDAAPCIRIDHESVSRRHATIEWRGPHLIVSDLGSKNGTRSEGQPQGIFQLVAGAVITFGAVHTVAYSARGQKVRAGLQRYLGYGAGAQADVERLQHSATTRRHVALVGPIGSGAHALARYLHETAPTSTWPLVAPDVLPVDDNQAQRALVAKAAYGTLVIDAHRRGARVDRLPRLFELLATNAYHVRLVLLAPPDATLEHLVGERMRTLLDVVTVPPLASRRDEWPRLLGEMIAHYASRHGAATELIGAADRAFLDTLIRGKGAVQLQGLDELEEVVLRLAVLRKHRTSHDAEDELGLKSRGALSKWATKYGVTMKPPGPRRREG